MSGKVSLIILISVLILPSLPTSLYLSHQVLFSIPTHICVTPSKLCEPVASGWTGPEAFGQKSSLVRRGGRQTLLFSRVSEQRNSGYTSYLLFYCLFHIIRARPLDKRMCLYLFLHVTFNRQNKMWRFSPDVFSVYNKYLEIWGMFWCPYVEVLHIY